MRRVEGLGAARQGIGDPGLPKALVAKHTRIAGAARTAVGQGVVAAPGQREVDAQLHRAAHDARLRERDERRVNRERALALDAGPGAEVRRALERVDVL